MNKNLKDYGKVCPNCGNDFVAKRLNQDYCTPTCRVQFNNHQTRDERITIESITSKVNDILLKNREVLYQLFLNKKTEVSIDLIQRCGFQLNYITKFAKLEDNTNLFYCYDMSYFFIDNQNIKIQTL
jgi:hypothetical protein